MTKNWINFRFLHICPVEKCEISPNLAKIHISPHLLCGKTEIPLHVEKFHVSKSEISPHDQYFSTQRYIGDIDDKDQVQMKLCSCNNISFIGVVNRNYLTKQYEIVFCILKTYILRVFLRNARKSTRRCASFTCICQSKFVRPVSLYVRTSLLKFSLVCTYTYMLPEISVSLYVRTDFLKFPEMIFKFPRKFVRLDLKSTFPVLENLVV